MPLVVLSTILACLAFKPELTFVQPADISPMHAPIPGWTDATATLLPYLSYARHALHSYTNSTIFAFSLMVLGSSHTNSHEDPEFAEKVLRFIIHHHQIISIIICTRPYLKRVHKTSLPSAFLCSIFFAKRSFVGQALGCVSLFAVRRHQSALHYHSST